MTDFNYDKSLHLKDLIPESEIKDIEVWIKKYPGNRKRPPIMPTLKIVQEYNGNYLTTDMMQAVAEYLDVPHVAVYEVATFYSMFNLNKMGKHVLSVCTNISCSLRGSEKVVKHLEDRLNIKLGETTEDGLFSIKEVECMAACGGAPMLEVDKVYHENLTPEKIDKILSDIASVNLSDSKRTESSDSKMVEGLSIEKEIDKTKSTAKKKTPRKKKKEIKPEPIFHLTPIKQPVKKSRATIEKELESVEKEIEKENQSSSKLKSLKKEHVENQNKEETAQKKENDQAENDDNKVSSLERAMLRSSDNGE